jgi:pimeloyl-ACP methyl ester carboxylesterase
MKAAVVFLLAALCALSPSRACAQEKIVVVGFVGGFVRHDDPRHAEVRFAAYLRERYRSRIDVAVFGNHSQTQALRYLLHVLAHEDGPARIIIFGHSWGGTETVRLARALERQHIPVLLTIQIDSIAKPGQENFTIPANVAHAVNFYQSTGLLHGRTEILAKDPERTDILGNFEMTYKDHPVDCNQFPWYSRFFTRSHIEIENDPRVWTLAATLIDMELSAASGAGYPGNLGTMRK